MARYRRVAIALLVFAACGGPRLGFAQAIKAGVVTALEGTVIATRSTAPQPIPLKFRDEVFFRDRIKTGEQSIARILLGGKAVVTIREHSLLTITEVPGHSTLDLDAGKIQLAVAREKMRGEAIDIRTFNAVAGVRGTVVVAEVVGPNPRVDSAAAARTTNFYLLHGSVEAVRLDPSTRAPIGPSHLIKVFERFSATGTAAGVVTPFSRADLALITSGLRPKGFHHTGAANQPQITAQAVRTATALATVLFGPQAGGTTGGAESEPASLEPQPAQETAPAVGEPPEADGVPEEVVVRGEPGGSAPAAISDPDQTTVGGEIHAPLVPPYPAALDTPDIVIRNATISSGQTLKTFDGTTSWTLVTPVMQVSNSTVTQGLNYVFEVSPGATVSLGSSLLDVSGSTIGAGGLLHMTSGSLTSTSCNPLFKIAQTTLSLGGSSAGGNLLLVDGVDPIVAGSLSLTGPLFAAIDSVVNGGSLVTVGGNASLTSSRGDPLLQWVGTTVSAYTLLHLADGAALTLGGPLLAGTNATVAVQSNLVEITNGGSLVTGSSDPLVAFTGGSLTVASGSVLHLAGRSALTAVEVADGVPLTLGTDRPLQHAGALLETSGTSVTAPTLVTVDSALLEASAPLLSATQGSAITTTGDALNLSYRAKVTSLGPVLALDRSSLTVSSGALVAVNGGSFLKVTGDLLQLSNGSTLTVPNGPLLSVSGNSVVNVSGALLAFAGSGGNTVTVANTLCAPTCTVLNGIRVALTGGATAANVSIGPNPFRNVGSGTLVTGGPLTALIRVNGPSSKVTITAP